MPSDTVMETIVSAFVAASIVAQACSTAFAWSGVWAMTARICFFHLSPAETLALLSRMSES